MTNSFYEDCTLWTERIAVVNTLGEENHASTFPWDNRMCLPEGHRQRWLTTIDLHLATLVVGPTEQKTLGRRLHFLTCSTGHGHWTKASGRKRSEAQSHSPPVGFHKEVV